MGLLSKLKSLLGMDQSDRSRGSGVDVTVERDPEADADSERAVKEGTDDAADADETDAAAAGTDAAASTESLVDEDAADSPDEAAEPAEAAVSEDTGDAPDAETESDEGDAEDAADAGDDDLTEIKGVGPAYADRLHDAGISTFADLAAADEDELADATDLSPKRVGRWIERAQHR